MSDLISRQEAIGKLNERQRRLIYCFGFENDMVKIMDVAKSIIIAMPSAEPDRSLWFRVGEICVDESKGFISAGRAVEKIRELLKVVEQWMI